MSNDADLQKVLELLAQCLADAKAIGAVSCELTITDAYGVGMMYLYSSQPHVEQGSAWH